jgi:hypothetical protein
MMMLSNSLFIDFTLPQKPQDISFRFDSLLKLAFAVSSRTLERFHSYSTNPPRHWFRERDAS